MQKFINSRGRIAVVAATVLLLVLIVFFSSLILKTYYEYRNFNAQQLLIKEELTRARKEFAYKEMYLNLLEDPNFLERVARERLGYARPDELLFRFSDEL